MPIDAEGYTVSLRCDCECQMVDCWEHATIYGENKRVAWRNVRNGGWKTTRGLAICPYCRTHAQERED